MGGRRKAEKFKGGKRKWRCSSLRRKKFFVKTFFVLRWWQGRPRGFPASTKNVLTKNEEQRTLSVLHPPASPLLYTYIRAI
jgi:hypothetical protein